MMCEWKSWNTQRNVIETPTIPILIGMKKSDRVRFLLELSIASFSSACIQKPLYLHGIVKKVSTDHISFVYTVQVGIKRKTDVQIERKKGNFILLILSSLLNDARMISDVMNFVIHWHLAIFYPCDLCVFARGLKLLTEIAPLRNSLFGAKISLTRVLKTENFFIRTPKVVNAWQLISSGALTLWKMVP